MEEKGEESNLPVEVKDKGMLSNPKVFKTLDAMKRVGKIAGSVFVTTAGFVVFASPVTPISLAGLGIIMGGTARLGQNMFLKLEPNLLFGTKKVNDEIGIYQDGLNAGVMTRMLGYEKGDRMAMMGMQSLVGLDRYKNALRDSKDFKINEKGQKVYNQKFSTVTHGINLNVLKALDALGYIELESIKQDFEGRTFEEKLLKKDEDGCKRSLLIGERLGFGNYKDAGKAIAAWISRDPERKKDNSKVMELATFRLTDKPIDIEEIKAAKRNPEYKSLPSATYKAIRLLSGMPRILENRNVQVVEDRTGRKTLKYPSRVENLKLVANKVKHKVKTLKKEIDKKRKSKEPAVVSKDVAKEQIEQQQEMFNESLKEGVTQPVVPTKETHNEEKLIENENIIEGEDRID